MSFRSRLVQVRDLPAGANVSYARQFTTRRPTRVGVVPVGYGHGYSWLLSNRGHMLVGGRRVSIMGRVTMDLTMVDVTDVPDVAVGDEVVLFGEQRGTSLPVEEVAVGSETLAYEILCTIGKRVTRLYVRQDHPVRVSTLIGERADWSAPVTDYLRRRDARARRDALRVFLIVLDGVGIGGAARCRPLRRRRREHAAARGRARGPALAAHARSARPRQPAPHAGCATHVGPAGRSRAPREKSAGKDSTTGHWEMMGIALDQPFPTYPDGFPVELLDRWSERVQRGWIGNVAASGTEIIARLGAQHQETGRFIVYTSADSVFQVAAHEQTVPIEQLYSACRAARDLLTGVHAVGRVIARPFEGEPGHYRRTSRRRDFSLAPPASTVLDRLVEAGRRVVTVGKVDDLFAGHGVSDAIHTTSNEEGEAVLLDLVKRAGEGLVFATSWTSTRSSATATTRPASPQPSSNSM
jgi:phosphopentomutase